MGRNIAIIAGAGLIALAILVSNHWLIVAPQERGLGIVRLNRWTGAIDICAINPDTIKGNNVAGAQLRCTQ